MGKCCARLSIRLRIYMTQMRLNNLDKILDFENNYFKRLIAEMIHIKTQDNSLNSIDDIECLNLILIY